LEKTSKIIESNHPPTPPFLLNHILKCHIYSFSISTRDTCQPATIVS